MSLKELVLGKEVNRYLIVDRILDREVTSSLSSNLFAGGMGMAQYEAFYRVSFRDRNGRKCTIYGESDKLKTLKEGDVLKLRLVEGGLLRNSNRIEVGGKAFVYDDVTTQAGAANEVAPVYEMLTV